jgi:uncharacterized protein (TIGR01615 family)
MPPNRSCARLQGRGDCAGRELIVECAFRDHFRIPCDSPEYASLLTAVPAVYVGSAGAMAPIVELVTHEMARAFAERGLTMPPWRSARSMMSKWAPQRATDRLPQCDAPRGRSVSPAAANESSNGGTGPLASARCGGGGDPRAQAAQVAVDAAPRGDAGALPRAVRRWSAGRTGQSLLGHDHHKPFGGGSPVLSVKVGFDFPRPGAHPGQRVWRPQVSS